MVACLSEKAAIILGGGIQHRTEDLRFPGIPKS